MGNKKGMTCTTFVRCLINLVHEDLGAKIFTRYQINDVEIRTFAPYKVSREEMHFVLLNIKSISNILISDPCL